MSVERTYRVTYYGSMTVTVDPDSLGADATEDDYADLACDMAEDELGCVTAQHCEVDNVELVAVRTSG